MEVARVSPPARVLSDPTAWHLAKWLVNTGAVVHLNQRLALLKSTTTGAVDHALAPHSGTLATSFVAEGDTIHPSKTAIAEIKFCPHSVVFKGVCAVCGEEAAPAHFAHTSSPLENRLPVAYSSESLSVTRAEAESVSSAAARKLFQSERLSLVLDLDHTLVHATDDARAAAVLHHSPENVDKSSVSSFSLGPISNPRLSALMHVKLRPHLAEFLARVSSKFELHIYTMGSRPYADQVAKLIDPDKRLFSGRITSREDFSEGLCNQKSINRLFPCDHSMVLIVDDREDVWISKTGQAFMPNLIRAEPYSFWDGLHEAYDRASSTTEIQLDRPVHQRAASPKPTAVVKKAKADIDNLESKQSPNPTPAMNGTEPPPVRHVREAHTASDQSDTYNIKSKSTQSSTSNIKENAASVEKSAHSPELQENCVNASSSPNDAKMSSTCKEKGDKPGLSSPVNNDENGTSTSGITESAVNVAGSNDHTHNEIETQESHQTSKGESVDKANGDEEGKRKELTTSDSRETASEDGKHIDHEPASAFSAELRKIVRGWWEADAASHSSGHLLRLVEILEECHSRFFSSPDAKGMSNGERSQLARGRFEAPADVKKILASMRRSVLAGCCLAFTGVVPIGIDPNTVPEWNLAQRLGAECSMGFVSGRTTHLVASEHRTAATQKVKEALESESTFVVTTSWLHHSAINFERQLELPYSIKVDNVSQSPLEYRRWVEEKYEVASKKLRKRDASRIDQDEPGDENDQKRRKADHDISQDSIESGEQSPPVGLLRVLSGDELGAAIDAAFED